MQTQVPNNQRSAIAEAFRKALAATPKRIAPAPAPEPAPVEQEGKVAA